ncbi:MAG: GvpL/GvpF family gas vesicle protein, partial [Candidatus Dormibacteraeota bacterium]|nr:GvpL/GvpF family gas vesicle protein [Candidatus Dormibacteraeota bacterium]
MTLYLYGLVAAGRRLPRGMKGVAGEKVRSLKLGSLGALASPIGGELALDLDDLGAHAAVVEAAFAKGPILPFRAGTVVEEDVLRNEVALYLPDYEAQLAELDGLCELEVTAWYREEPV